MTSAWPAPVAPGPVRATVAVPGSKSVTNRALVLAALAATPTTLHRPLRSRDTQLMVGGLRAMGVTVDDSHDSWQVVPGPQSVAMHGFSSTQPQTSGDGSQT